MKSHVQVKGLALGRSVKFRRQGEIKLGKGSWWWGNGDFSMNLLSCYLSSLIAQSIRNLPAIQETWVRSLSWEEPLEKEMATHSSILARRIPWTENPGRL